MDAKILLLLVDLALQLGWSGAVTKNLICLSPLQYDVSGKTHVSVGCVP